MKKLLAIFFVAPLIAAFPAGAEDGVDDPALTPRLVVGGKSEAVASAVVESPAPASPVALETTAPSVEVPIAEVKPKETAKLPENQIPVLTGAKDTKKAAGGGMSRIFVSLGVLAVALLAAIFGLKRIGRRNGQKNQNTRIKVLTQHSLGQKKSLAIVQVAGESILIGVTDQNISMLKTLSLIDDEFPEEMPRHFDTALDDYREPETARPRAQRGEDDDFAVQGLSEIRDRVSTRLRSMKNL